MCGIITMKLQYYWCMLIQKENLIKWVSYDTFIHVYNELRSFPPITLFCSSYLFPLVPFFFPNSWTYNFYHVFTPFCT
jgi:hypothetical protein